MPSLRPTTRGKSAVIVALVVVASFWASSSASQNTLGELLDAGATKLSAADFKLEVVQRVIVGPTASGGTIEIMYVPDGMIQGVGRNQVQEALQIAPVYGEWTTDDSGRICTRMRIGGGAGGSTHGLALPARCQHWYRHGGQYFFADSDTDRSARVLRRAIKP